MQARQGLRARAHSGRLSLRLVLVLLAAISLPLFAGGPVVQTVQNGDWADGSTWDTGTPPSIGSGDQAGVNHVVEVTTSSEANVANIGYSGPGTVNVTTGNLTVDFSIEIGNGAPGVLDVSGGSVLTGNVDVGFGDGGILDVTGGSVDVDAFYVGSGVSGLLRIQGNTPTLTSFECILDGQGTLQICPTANGAAGLSPIITGDLYLQGGCTIELDTTCYTPTTGDSWVVATYSALHGGGISNLVAPAGYTISADTSGGEVRITVTDTPLPVEEISWGGLKANTR